MGTSGKGFDKLLCSTLTVDCGCSITRAGCVGLLFSTLRGGYANAALRDSFFDLQHGIHFICVALVALLAELQLSVADIGLPH